MQRKIVVDKVRNVVAHVNRPIEGLQTATCPTETAICASGEQQGELRPAGSDRGAEIARMDRACGLPPGVLGGGIGGEPPPLNDGEKKNKAEQSKVARAGRRTRAVQCGCGTYGTSARDHARTQPSPSDARAASKHQTSRKTKHVREFSI